MKYVKFLIAGLVFGVVMAKSEAFSWFRIQEMFRFQSFHMYGIIGTAVALGAPLVWLIKRYRLRDFEGNPIELTPKAPARWRYVLGGTVFGLGWALSGACPGPMFVSLGYGVWSMGIVILGALAGTYLYGLFKDKLPN